MRKSVPKESKGLKTFFAYSGIVLLFILIALFIKFFFIVQESKFDGRHQFVLTIVQKEKTLQVLRFNPSMREISILEFKEGSAGIISDAAVDIGNSMQVDTDVSSTLGKITMQYSSVKTDLTIIDVLRLMFLSYRSKTILADERFEVNDDTVSSENISVQIINASGVSGMGNRLEKALEGFGFNIIAVITARDEEKLSKIQFFGEKTYTLEKLGKLLKFPVEKIEREGLADIMIIIGVDAKDSKNF